MVRTVFGTDLRSACCWLCCSASRFCPLWWSFILHGLPIPFCSRLCLCYSKCMTWNGFIMLAMTTLVMNWMNWNRVLFKNALRLGCVGITTAFFATYSLCFEICVSPNLERKLNKQFVAELHWTVMQFACNACCRGCNAKQHVMLMREWNGGSTAPKMSIALH